MPVTIKLRGGTAAEWTAADPVLAAREMGLETNTMKFKVGDGSTAWANLPYWGGADHDHDGNQDLLQVRHGTSSDFTGSEVLARGEMLVVWPDAGLEAIPDEIKIGNGSNDLSVLKDILSEHQHDFASSGHTHSTPMAIVKDRKALGTEGGTFNQGAYQTRDLNHVEHNDIGLSLSNNQITLPPGVYFLRAEAPAFATGRHQLRLYDVGAASAISYGQQNYAYGNGSVQNNAVLVARLSLASQTIFEIQHRCQVSRADDGFGQEIQDWWESDYSYYTQVVVWQL